MRSSDLQAEILKNVAERPRSPKSLRDGSSDTQSTDSWGRMHGSNSDHPLSHVHITIGNSIQDKLHLEDMVSPVPSTTGGAIQPLDSIPENMRSTDDEGASAAGPPDSDTLEMLLPGPYSIEAGEAMGDSRGGPRRPPRPPPPRRDAGAASDGMFHVSMDRSDIDSLPVLDSAAGPLLPSSLPNSVRTSSGRHVFGAPGADEGRRAWPRQQTQPSSGSDDGAFDPSLCELARSMPLTDTAHGGSANAAPQNPLGTQRNSDASAIETSGAMSGSGPHGGGGASLVNTSDCSPTLPPMTSPFTFDLLRQRSARGVVTAYATPSPFDAEAAVAEAAEAAVALGSGRAPPGASVSDASDFPPLEAGKSASFRTRIDAPPMSPELASPFDSEPAAQPPVSFASGGSAGPRQDKTAPFFRPSDTEAAVPDSGGGGGGAFVPPGEAGHPPRDAAAGPGPAATAATSPAMSVRGTNDTVSPTSIGEDPPAHLSVHSNQQSLSMSSTLAHGGGESRSPTKALPPRPEGLPEAVISSQNFSPATAMSIPMSIPRLSDAPFGASSFDAEPPIASLNTFTVQQYNTPFSRPPSQSERSRRTGSAGSGGRRGERGDRGCSFITRTGSNASRTVSNASRLGLADIAEAHATAAAVAAAAAPAVAPLLQSSFDAEPTFAAAHAAAMPPSARANVERRPSSSPLAQPAFHAAPAVQQLASGFDVEPGAVGGGFRGAIGAGVGGGFAGAFGVPGVGGGFASAFAPPPASHTGDAVVPTLMSGFDVEPAAAAASGRPPPPTFAAEAPHVPQLMSGFDVEPPAAAGDRPPPVAAQMPPSMFDADSGGAGGGLHLAAPHRASTPLSRSSSHASVDHLRSLSRQPSHDHSAGLSRVVSSTRCLLGMPSSTAARPHTPSTPSPLHAEPQHAQHAQRQLSGLAPVAPALPTSFGMEPPAAHGGGGPPRTQSPASPAIHAELPTSITAEQRISSHALRMDSGGLGGTSSFTPSPIAHLSRASVFDIDPPSSVGSMASATGRERPPPPVVPAEQPAASPAPPSRARSSQAGGRSPSAQAPARPPPAQARTRSPKAQQPVRFVPREDAAAPPLQRNASAILRSVRDSLASVSGNSRSPHAEVFSRNPSPEQPPIYQGFTGVDSPDVSAEGNVAQLAAEQGAAATAATHAQIAAAVTAHHAHRVSPFYSGHTVAAEDVVWGRTGSVAGPPQSLPTAASGLLSTLQLRRSPPQPGGADSVRASVRVDIKLNYICC